MENKDFVMLTIDDFKTEAEQESLQHPESFKVLLKKVLTSSKEEIYIAYYECLMLPKTLKFIIALLIIKLSHLAPIDTNYGVQFFPNVDFFLESYPEHKTKALEAYANGLEIEILNSDKETLLNWYEKLLKYRKEVCLETVFKLIPNKLLQFLYLELSEITENSEKESFNQVFETLKTLLLIDPSQEEFVKNEAFTLARIIADKYDLNGIKKKTNQSYDPKIKDLMYFWKLFINLPVLIVNEKNNEMNLIKLGVKKIQEFKKEFLVENHFNQIDIEVLKYSSNKPFYWKDFGSGARVEVFRGLFNEKKVIIKHYLECTNELLDSVNKEVRILSFLSEKRNQNSLFLKFYGSHLDKNNCFLIIEDGGDQNLMEYISQLNSNHNTICKKTLNNWVSQLIRTFAWLNTNKIIHRDIKPHNLLVSQKNESLQIKIIDFSVSDLLDEQENTFEPTDIISIQGTKGYIAPELYQAIQDGKREVSHKPGKSDVFSLGLTILQLYTFKDYHGWNNPKLNLQLICEVESLDVEYWVKHLLKNMLVADPKARPSFRTCLGFLIDEQTIINF